MKKAKLIEYNFNVFEEAQKCFRVYMINYSNKLENLEENDVLPRFNRIKIKIEYIEKYSQEILFLNVKRTDSKIGDQNFYSYALFTDSISPGNQYEITFLNFDAFNEIFNKIEVSIMDYDDYQKRKLNLNGAKMGKQGIIEIKKFA